MMNFEEKIKALEEVNNRMAALIALMDAEIEENEKVLEKERKAEKNA